MAYYAFAEEIGAKYTPEQSQLLAQWIRLIRSAGWIFTFDGLCVISKPPMVVDVDERGRIHGAVKFGDGWGVWAHHGVRVDRRIIERPETITAAEIDKERNAEVRRVMLAQFGTGRFLLESGAKEIHRDAFGILYRKELANDEPLVMVRVLNSTPEPDGTLTKADAEAIFGVKMDGERAWWEQVFRPATQETRWKEYQIRVPPTIRTAREAVAWIAGAEPNAYAPIAES